MSCWQIQPELVGYHFGAVDGATRQQVEQHLLECSDCLRSFLALKRDLETAESGPRPSPALSARLRQDVAAELGLVSRPWRWWERPLAFGLAGAAVVVAVLAVGALVNAPGALPHGMQAASVSAPASAQFIEGGPAASPQPE